MKFAVKTLVLGMCIVGASAAFATSHIGSVPMVASHEAVSAVPIPTCTPGTRCPVAAVPIPTCTPGTKCHAAAVPIPTCTPGTKCH
jgi:hypothetical protein